MAHTKWVEISRIEEKAIKRLLSRGDYIRFYNKLETLLASEEMSLFAKPRDKGPIGSWEYQLSKEQETVIKSYDKLTEEEKENIADRVEELRHSIQQKISNDVELKHYTEQLFDIPDESAIILISRSDRDFPVLTQWACRFAKGDPGISVLHKIFKKRAKDRSRVTLSFSYSDGGPLTKTDFAFEYNGVFKKIIPNTNGERDLGTFKHNSTITLSQYYKGQPFGEKQITVEEQDKVYPVEFPFLTEATVQVVNQKEEPIAQLSLSVTSKGKQQNLETDESGKVLIDFLESGETLELSAKDDTAQFQLGRENNHFTFKVTERIIGGLLVNVLDRKSKEPVANYPIKFIQDGAGTTYTSDHQGKIYVKEIEVGAQLLLRDGDDEEKTTEHTYSLDLKTIDFYIDKPELPNIRVNVLTRKKEPVAGASIVFNGNPDLNRQTNESGFCELAHGSFADESKVKASVEIIKEAKKDGKKKTKKYKGSFKYHQDQSSYTLIIGRNYRWLWLLLLLLPLLLLIPFKKDIGVEVFSTETNEGVAGVNVHLAYEYSALFANGELFFHDTIPDTQKTDATGHVTFKELNYTLYSWLFKRGNWCRVNSYSDCFTADSIDRKFHSIDNQEVLDLHLSPAFLSLDFKVVDIEDKEPLPEARVQIMAEFDGKSYIDSGLTDPAGRIVFDRLPKCAIIQQVEAQLFGYYPDSIGQTTLLKLTGPIEDYRTLELKPIRKPISFFVVDCNSKKPIPNAAVTIEFDNPKAPSKSMTVKTNVNGVGKGVYGKAHIISRIHLSGTHPYYYPGELAGWHLVNQFTNYSESDRTFCLEPKPKPIEFKNVDAETDEPLVGVKNTVYINGKKVEEQTSGGRGTFIISDLKNGDRLSIVSEFPPNYQQNDYTIRDVDVYGTKLFDQPISARTIPLTPETINLVFRTVDSTTWNLLRDVSLSISRKGTYNAPNNSGNGEFTVKARRDAVITIEANKAGYETNNSKIRNDRVYALQKAVQRRRDIPLLEDVPEICETPKRAGDYGDPPITYDLKHRHMNYSIEWDMKTIPDRIKVYCGRNTRGRILVDSRVLVKDTGKAFFTLQNCRSTKVTVEIISDNPNTSWTYKFNCD